MSNRLLQLQGTVWIINFISLVDIWTLKVASDSFPTIFYVSSVSDWGYKGI